MVGYPSDSLASCLSLRWTHSAVALSFTYSVCFLSQSCIFEACIKTTKPIKIKSFTVSKKCVSTYSAGQLQLMIIMCYHLAVCDSLVMVILEKHKNTHQEMGVQNLCSFLYVNTDTGTTPLHFRRQLFINDT